LGEGINWISNAKRKHELDSEVSHSIDP